MSKSATKRTAPQNTGRLSISPEMAAILAARWPRRVYTLSTSTRPAHGDTITVKLPERWTK